MIKKLALLLLILIQFDSLGQVGSTWNLMSLKKGTQLEIQGNMAE
jgi:hypothetical protein